MFIPVRHLWWLAAGGSAGYTARYMKARINFALAERRRRRTPDPSGELLRLQTLYGYNAHSMVSIAPGAELWSTPDIDGAIIRSRGEAEKSRRRFRAHHRALRANGGDGWVRRRQGRRCALLRPAKLESARRCREEAARRYQSSLTSRRAS